MGVNGETDAELSSWIGSQKDLLFVVEGADDGQLLVPSMYPPGTVTDIDDPAVSDRRAMGDDGRE